MNAFFTSAAVALNPLIGIVITVAGALIGGKLAGDAPLGVLLGIIAGSALALGLCGIIAMLGQVVDAIEQPGAAQAAAPANYAAATGAGAGARANGAAGHAAPAKDDLAATQAAIRAAAAGDGDAVLAGVDDALADFIKRGDFSGFHLAKGKRLLAEGNLKDAAYQASASLAHNPGNQEARALRAAARQKR